ncbi:Octaprenyl-diphosphate synthase / Dimethylallyltransferase / Geranyltranstransferase (farnesyldiphosphate synthase) / Geranylgeranyl pyrophosphate synthetase [Thioalkalivibrio nitratireducens DSM 14787]|uniref:Octaprenyl diphosphate synthase n=2 Tax=Thioalkalivibrio nitratireducens TaxID=186931 RepID=L0DSB2_THIND|nr:Octaprenyl-diphosphate synthase / Dimethylallyltransferase / Geranyltranstransferase (farnesyldiphosphate synthase) / Geranylgeranyl pyrophosphate synthetase [Thioalkalivibrio nitratireducens DSM 14787]
MQAVDQCIRERLASPVALINQLSHYIIRSGGKRLRPLLAVLAARACGYQGPHHVTLAAVVEFIHTATLLHDDVVDASELRRGQETANQLFGNEAAVLVGDFLYSRAFEMMVDVGSMRVMEILAHATNVIAEGEVMQLMNCHDADVDEARYMEVIRSKTAKLFEAACQMGAVLAEMPNAEEQALAHYGMHLGTAFQLIDDVLDYSADSEVTGKRMGDDLAEGKPTLPLIQALRIASPEGQTLIRGAIESGGRDHVDEILAIVRDSGALDYARARAEAEASAAIAALELLPPSPHRDVLTHLARFAVERDH